MHLVVAVFTAIFTSCEWRGWWRDKAQIIIRAFVAQRLFALRALTLDCVLCLVLNFHHLLVLNLPLNRFHFLDRFVAARRRLSWALFTKRPPIACDGQVDRFICPLLRSVISLTFGASLCCTQFFGGALITVFTLGRGVDARRIWRREVEWHAVSTTTLVGGRCRDQTDTHNPGQMCPACWRSRMQLATVTIYVQKHLSTRRQVATPWACIQLCKPVNTSVLTAVASTRSSDVSSPREALQIYTVCALINLSPRACIFDFSESYHTRTLLV